MYRLARHSAIKPKFFFYTTVAPQQLSFPEENLGKRFTSNLSELLRRNHLLKATAQIDEFRKRYKPNKILCNQFMKVYTSNGDEIRANQLLSEMQNGGEELSPDVLTYNFLMTMYGKKHQVHRVMEFYQHAIQLSKDDIQTYNNILKCYLSNSMWDEADKLYKEIKSRKTSSPNIVTYHLMINLYGELAVTQLSEKEGERAMKACLGVVEDMKADNNVTIDIKMYNCILKVFSRFYGRKGNTEPVLVLYKEIVESAVRPDQVTFNTLLHMFCVIGLEEGVKSCLDSMKIYGIKPDVTTYTTIIHMWAKVTPFGDCVGL
eukprot:TRINITY_DN6073_c0_g1_i8.p1 TRINITY_DN6073_c0_g1~~TRINITY_DN6073_c0_g1_i8.p1  ORF type:complete len:318 (-),score=66.78 TRINITY_DN6073_c0_g1_i8:530-1483(-)